MASYSVTCSCGHTDTIEADSRESAIAMFKTGMTAEAIAEHMSEYHDPGDPIPTVVDAHAMIEQLVVSA